MKILITILLALFISSNTSADYEFKSIRDVCIDFETSIIITMNRIIENPLWREDMYADPELKKKLQEHAKIFHYLECSNYVKEEK